MKRKIIVGIIVLLVIVAAVGYWMYSKKVTNYAQEQPDITIKAQELVGAFENDTAAAGRRFMDKIIRVSGTVKSFDSSAVVIGEEGNPSDVVAGFDDRNLRDIQQIKIGQEIIIQGKFSGYNKGAGDDLISSLGTTIKIDYAGIVKSNHH